MYDNIGKKIKGLAIAVFAIGAIVSFIKGFEMIDSNTDSSFDGILVIILGSFIAWISSWVLYGFGELVDKACDIEIHTREIANKSRIETIEDPATGISSDAYEEPFGEVMYSPDGSAGNYKNTYLKDYWICGRCQWHNNNDKTE